MDTCSAEYIGYLLATNDRAVERALVLLYKRQTIDEQSSKETRHKNGRGFNAGDARKGTYMAEYILKGSHLSGKWIFEARAMVFKYINQLVEEALLKRERQQMQVSIQQAEQDSLMHRIDREVAEEKAILEGEV